MGGLNLKGILMIVVGIVLLGALIPALWPTIEGSSTAVAALTQTDAGTKILQALWPIVILVCAAGLAIGAVMYVLHKARLGK